MGLKVHHRFTSNEIKFLKSFYPTRSTKKIASDLKRSVSAIRTKACQLGLSKTKEYRSKTAKIPNDGHFKKNQSSWNKGLKLGSDWGGVHTRFQPGQEPHNKLPVEIKEVNGLIKKLKKQISRI
jgi:hypothetical protein